MDKIKMDELRAAAEKQQYESWAFGTCDNIEFGSVSWGDNSTSGFIVMKRSRAEFIAMADPKTIIELLDMLDELEAQNDHLTDLFERLSTWAHAYPLSLFPEPDFEKAREVLKEAGVSLDAISASNMQHVINRVIEICDDAKKAGEE